MDLVLIVVSIFGVVLGFFMTEKALKRRRFPKSRVVSVERLPSYLYSRYLVRSAVSIGGKTFKMGVDDEEVNSVLKAIGDLGDEVIVISGVDLKYVLKRDNVFVYLTGKISIRDFADIWTTIHKSLEVVK